MKGYKTATNFAIRVIVGSVLAIFFGLKIDAYLSTTPLFLILLLIYVIGGSLILLIKELK